MAERTDGLFFKMSPYYDDDEAFFDLEHPLSELLWVRGNAYCKKKNTDGVIPAKALKRLTTRFDIGDPELLAKDLVQADLWIDQGDGTFLVRSYTQHQTTKAEQEAKREKKRAGGLASAHQRGSHADGPRDGCPLCSPPDEQPLSTCSTPAEQSGTSRSTGSNQSTEHRVQSSEGEEILVDAASGDADETPEPHEDDTRICDHLADAIELRTQKRPKQPARWLNDARLLRERGPTDWAEAEPIPLDTILRAIDWAMANDFWAANIQSPAALRKHWTRMVFQSREQKRTGRIPDNAGLGVDMYEELKAQGLME